MRLRFSYGSCVGVAVRRCGGAKRTQPPKVGTCLVDLQLGCRACFYQDNHIDQALLLLSVVFHVIYVLTML